MPVPMVSDILVPLDGSDAADRAIPVAARLAARMGARLHLVAVARPLVATGSGMLPGMAVYPTDVDAVVHVGLVTHLDTRGEDVELLYGVPVLREVLAGETSVPDQLMQYASEHDVDLIVMRSHGRSAVGRLCLGSVGDALVQRAGIPCLLLRDRHHPPRGSRTSWAFSRILVPLDSTPESEAGIEQALGLATPGVTEIRLLVVVPEKWVPVPGSEYAVPAAARLANAEAYARGLARRLTERGYVAHGFTVSNSSPARAIADCVEEQHIDLVSISSHHRSGPDRLMFGSVIDTLLHETDVPILARRADLAELQRSIAVSESAVSATCSVPGLVPG